LLVEFGKIFQISFPKSVFCLFFLSFWVKRKIQKHLTPLKFGVTGNSIWLSNNFAKRPHPCLLQAHDCVWRSDRKVINKLEIGFVQNYV
jgi:hypothetical protein